MEAKSPYALAILGIHTQANAPLEKGRYVELYFINRPAGAPCGHYLILERDTGRQIAYAEGAYNSSFAIAFLEEKAKEQGRVTTGMLQQLLTMGCIESYRELPEELHPAD